MSQRPRILVADDEIGPREALRFLLKEEYDLVFAEDGREALAFLHMTPPDLILMDIRMPHLDGWETIREIRKEGILVPIIVITGYPNPTDKEWMRELNVSAYLSKPFDLFELQKLIRTILAERN